MAKFKSKTHYQQISLEVIKKLVEAEIQKGKMPQPAKSQTGKLRE